MSWFQLIPALAATAAIVFLPGYLVVRCWAVRGLVAVGTAAPASVSIVAIAAVLAPKVGVRWSVLVVLALAVVAAAVGLVGRRFFPRALGIREHHPRPLRARWTLLVHAGALLIPALLITRGLTSMIGPPDNISQTYDNVFHLNAIRYILDTRSGSSLALGGMYSHGAHPSMYPGAWHDVVSLVVQVAGVSIPAAVNAVTVVVGALVWPISCIFLATRVTGTKPVPVLLAGALSAAFGAFPYLMVDYGVLYPYFLALALLPAALALLTMATGVGMRAGTPRWLAVLGIALVAPGIGLAHPSTLLALALFAVPIMVVGLVRYRRAMILGRASTSRYWAAAVVMVGYVGLVLVLWIKLRPSGQTSKWPPVETTAQAVGKIASGAFAAEGAGWVVLVLTLVAVGLAMRRQLAWWLVGTYLIAAGLYVVVAATPRGKVRDFITGVWYNDTFRLAGQLPGVIVVVATVAATYLFTRAVALLAARRPSLAHLRSSALLGPRAAAVAFVVAGLVGVFARYDSVPDEVVRGAATYTMDEKAAVLSPDERRLLERLDDRVPAGDSIVGNPWTGTALAYAYSGRRMLTPHVGGRIPAPIRHLMDGLDFVRDDPEICATVRDLRAYYVLDFDGPQVHHRNKHFAGLDFLSANPAVTEIDHEGAGARLYKITAC